MGLPKARIPPKPHATFSLVRQVLTRVVREVAYAVSQIHAISFDKAAVRLLKQKRDFGFHGSGTDHRKIQLPIAVDIAQGDCVRSYAGGNGSRDYDLTIGG